MIVYADEQLQHSPEWYKARLGNVTGSKCGDIMVKGRTKDAVFGCTAMSYLYQLAAERSINEAVLSDKELFGQYLEQEGVTPNKAMRWGTEHEDEARKLFEKIYGRTVCEVSSCRHDEIEHFAASPDGVVVENLRPVACVEIKCPGQKAFMQYCVEVTDAETLKKTNSAYYWQIQAEMMCTGTGMTYFCVYNPFIVPSLHVVEIDRNDEDCALLAERVKAANAVIHDILTQNILNHE